jgi:phage-related minor tail protein
MPSGAVTVGGLVINMSADTAQLKSDMAEGARVVDNSAKSMINSMTGITESSGSATDAGQRLVRQLKEEIATFGMTSQELTQYKANLNGVGAEVQALLGRLDGMKNAQAGLSAETNALAVAEANATARIRDMVAASMVEVNAMNEATAATQGLSAAQSSAARVSATWAESQRLQAQNMAGVAASMKVAQSGTAALSAETQKILDRYDPFGTKLRALQSDLANLRKAMGNSVDPAAIKAFEGLEEEIAKTQALMAKAGVEGFGEIEKGANKGAFATAGAKRELMVLGHEALTGNFSKMPGSFMVLAERMHMTAEMFSPMNIGMVALAAAAIGVAAAIAKGHDEMVAMDNALLVTSNYAGASRQSMEQLAESMTQTHEVTIAAAKEIVLALTSSGKIGGDAINLISHFISDFAKSTGQSVDEITPKMISMFTDPLKGAEELNSSMHFLTTTQIEHIASLERTGQVQAAQTELAKAAADHMPKQAENIGYVTKAILDQRDAWSKLIDKIKEWGTTRDQPDQKAQDLRDQISEYLASGLTRQNPAVKAVQAQLDALEPAIAKQKELTQAEKDAAAANELQAKSWDAVKASSAAYHIQELRDRLKLIEAHKSEAGPDFAAQEAAKRDAIRKTNDEIDAAQRSIGAVGRQATQQQINDEEQLDLLKLKGSAAAIDTEYKLASITKEQFDMKMTANALDENMVKQIFERRMANVAGLTEVERQGHLNKLKMLEEERSQIEQKGASSIDIDAKKSYDDIFKAAHDAGVANIASLDQQIAKQREHNAEIGKTKEQIELARQAQVDLDTKQLQSDADYLRDGMAKWDLDEKSRALYEARLSDLDAEISRRRTLAGLLNDGANAEAGAKAAADVAKYLDPTKAQNFGNALKGSLSGAAKSMVDLTSAMSKFGAEQAKNDKARQEAELARKSGTATQVEYLAQIGQINARNTKEQLASYGNMASAAAGFFDEHSRGYQTLMKVSQVFHAAELAMNLASIAPAMAAGAAQFFAQSGWGGFAGVAAMAAVVAGFGVAVSGGGGGPSVAQQRQASQGTGTVLGDGSAKSNSIAKAIELTASNSNTQINYLSGMLTTLQSIQSGIGSFAAKLVQTTNVSNPNVGNLAHGYGTTNLGAADMTLTGAEVGSYFGPIGTAVGAVVGYIASKIPVFQNIFTSIMGGKQSVSDSGFTMQKSSLGNILANGTNAESYADITTSGGWFSSDKHSTQMNSLGADANKQFTQILKSLGDGIEQAGVLLGMNGDDFANRLNSFVVDIGKVSLKGLSGDDLQKALESVFSKLGDQMAQYAIGGLEQFQQVGEGYLQTLTRVATDYAKMDASLASIGKTFGAVGLQSIAARESLIALLGGIDEFQSKTADYAKNFLTTAQQLAPVQKYVTDSLAKMGLGWVSTRQQFAGVVAGLDLTTAAGQDTYAALMNLEGAFAATHAAIVDTTKSAQDIADERKDLQTQLDQLTMTSAQLLAKQRDALDDSNKALFDQVQAAQKVKDAQDAAKTSLGNFITQMKSFATTAKGLNNSLVLGALSTLTPEQQYAEARRQFEQTRQQAAAGDSTAQGNLQSIEQTFLQLSQKLNGGDAQYSSDLAVVMRTNDDLAKWASQSVDVAQASLDALNGSSATLTDISATLTTIAQSVQYLPAAVSGQGVTGLVQAAAPINYSSIGTGNMTALVQEIKALRASNEAMATELKGLRADQQKQTGDLIQAGETSAEKAAEIVVDGVRQASSDAAWASSNSTRKLS